MRPYFRNDLRTTLKILFLWCVYFVIFSFPSLSPATATEGMKAFERKKLSPILKQHHLSFPDCGLIDQKKSSLGLRFFTYQLDKTTDLYGLLCDSSAFNTSFALYLVRDDNFHNTERLYFPTYSKALGWAGSNTLYNASYDPDTKHLKAKTKFHAEKDCGNQSYYKWTGKGFRLLTYRVKERCSRPSSRKWPLVYRYKKNRHIAHNRRSYKSRQRRASRKYRRRRAKRLSSKAWRKRQKRMRRRRYVQRACYKKKRVHRKRRRRLRKICRKARYKKRQRRRRRG